MIIRRRRSPLAPHDRAFLDFATGLVDSHRLASALADTPINAEDMAVDGEPGYVWAQALHGDVLVALGHPDQAIRRAQWDHCHMCGAPQTLAEVLGSTELVVLGTADRPFRSPARALLTGSAARGVCRRFRLAHPTGGFSRQRAWHSLELPLR